MRIPMPRILTAAPAPGRSARATRVTRQGGWDGAEGTVGRAARGCAAGGVRREGVRRWGVRRWGRHGAGSPRRGAPVARPGAWRPVRLQARTAVTAPAPPPAPGTGVPGGQWAHGPAHAAPKRTRRPDAPVRRVPGTAAGWRAGRVSRGRSWAQDLGRG